jgi:hypothetical protein
VNAGQPITQILAIVLHLDQIFPQMGFLPIDPLARAQALSTLAWMNNTVHPTFTHIFMPQKFSDQPEVQAALKPYNTQLFRSMLGELQGLVQAAAGKGQPAHEARQGAEAVELTVLDPLTAEKLKPSDPQRILRALELTPPELSADIYSTGLYLTGGGALLRGLDKRIATKTKLPVHVAEDPLRAVVRGTGMALKNLKNHKFLMT